MNTAVETLIFQLDQSFNKKAWHGPNLKASIHGVDAVQAIWRPQLKRHNIAEQVLHAAYWKYVVRRKLRGDKRGSFPLKGSNWFPVSGRLNETQWSEHKRLLDEQHEQLREAILELDTGKRGALSETQLRLITGVAAHDVYHAGQIRLLRSMWDSKR